MTFCEYFDTMEYMRKNIFERMLGQRQPAEESQKEVSKAEMLQGYRDRLEELKQWSNHWTIEDRNLAENLQNQITKLEQELSQSQ
ncbi:MAG: hypothetical protein A2925_04765 [Candidatus Yanofskybacteria bacterium RIFCSPLOWO2_01_FULL_44_22]|uniref:Uncharacterized protein n=2 Tax=Candidatus Yanofskyibacteriota TaxID=1752733 RepID=A0A1F8GL05_9BACT|nr:MAG: hypothetical protein UW79_C0001G0049 [Candidatus Yanofskybacteria bacterium GW2011_GWA2_44_9]OGN26011.1 MAG: hypothetical protein A2925_04765 [Candidatus Yanofskybacteria bacterium RIFCSPLOWO2_01_FULL_44_22]